MAELSEAEKIEKGKEELKLAYAKMLEERDALRKEQKRVAEQGEELEKGKIALKKGQEDLAHSAQRLADEERNRKAALSDAETVSARAAAALREEKAASEAEKKAFWAARTEEQGKIEAEKAENARLKASNAGRGEKLAQEEALMGKKIRILQQALRELAE